MSLLSNNIGVNKLLLLVFKKLGCYLFTTGWSASFFVFSRQHARVTCSRTKFFEYCFLVFTFNTPVKVFNVTGVQAK